jgi:hypothetical protein
MPRGWSRARLGKKASTSHWKCPFCFFLVGCAIIIENEGPSIVDIARYLPVAGMHWATVSQRNTFVEATMRLNLEPHPPRPCPRRRLQPSRGRATTFFCGLTLGGSGAR